MNENINALEVANSPAIWALCAIAVLAVFCETLLFFRLARKTAKSGYVDLTPKQCHRALRAGVVSAIGPAFGVFIVMIGLIAVLGGPMAWLRLSVIGGATTELTAASVGVKALGGDLSEALEHGPAVQCMVDHGHKCMRVASGGPWIFASRMEKVRTKIGGGDDRWMEIFSSAATLGIFGAFCSEYVVTAVQGMDFTVVIAMVVSAVAMAVLMKVADKVIWLKEYCLGIAMLAGIIVGLIIS